MSTYFSRRPLKKTRPQRKRKAKKKRREKGIRSRRRNGHGSGQKAGVKKGRAVLPTQLLRRSAPHQLILKCLILQIGNFIGKSIYYHRISIDLFDVSCKKMFAAANKSCMRLAFHADTADFWGHSLLKILEAK
ncbi:MAG: hypothetical protein Q3X95_02170, partial [Duodenibacillus sp.]|nr:hypothetical protein [Duodenibacillus sp.]